MMCFAGCEEKGNEITTEKNGNTDENVEITEANILGKWSCYKDVDYYEGEEEVHVAESMNSLLSMQMGLLNRRSKRKNTQVHIVARGN